ncbi:SRPBCC family protein [Hydrogenimonas sp.]
MQFEERITVNAAPEEIFSLYEDVSGWAEWDPEVLSASIEGSFEPGTRGKLKPAKGPEAKIEIAEVVKNSSFTVVSRLPLCTMHFEHILLPAGDKATEVVHRVRFTGMSAPLFGRLIGSGIHRGLSSSLEGLKSAVESKSR